MREFDLVAVVSGAHARVPVPGVQMVVHAGMTAVLTGAPRQVLRLPQSQRQMLLETATRLSWQEACLTVGTVLPARANSPLSLQAAMDFLVANGPELDHLFQRLQGLVQIQITVKWDEAAVLTKFRHAVELAPLFAGGAVQPSTVAQSVQKLARRLSAQMSLMLAEVSQDIVALPLVDTLLWNGALLVDAHRIDAISRAVEAIDDIWPEGLSIRQIGPAPVGSFATLSLQRVDPAQIKAALATFGLGSLREIDLLPQRRRERLMAGADVALRQEAEILQAAARLSAPRGFALARVLAEGQRADQHREVA